MADRVGANEHGEEPIIYRVVGSGDAPWLGHLIFDQSPVIDPTTFQATVERRLDTREEGGSRLAMQTAETLYPVPVDGALGAQTEALLAEFYRRWGGDPSSTQPPTST